MNKNFLAAAVVFALLQEKPQTARQSPPRRSSKPKTAPVAAHPLTNISLTEKNTVFYEGETSAALPNSITSGNGTDPEIFSPQKIQTTQAQNKTPYQIYEIKLTPDQQAHTDFQLIWTGSTGDSQREVTLYLFNYLQNQWVQAASGWGAGTFSIEANITNNGILSEGKMTLLVWRGINQAIQNRKNFIPATGQYDFNLFWTTDTQFYAETKAYMPYLKTQFNWMISNFQTLKSKMLLHTGDIVNVWKNTSQWDAMDNIMASTIESAQIPYLMVTGNHDVTADINKNIYQNYFPAARMQKNNPYFGGSLDNKNFYCLLNAKGAKLLILGMGVQLTAADADWAAGILRQHPNATAIVLTHNYLAANGTVELNSRYTDVPLMRTLLAEHENIRLLLCGHYPGANVNIEWFGDRPVCSILHDYQSLAYGGLGLFRMLKFDIENNLLYVNTYSASLNSTEWFTHTAPPAKGLYQRSVDEFAVEIDFGASNIRTLTTVSLNLNAANKPQLV